MLQLVQSDNFQDEYYILKRPNEKKQNKLLWLAMLPIRLFQFLIKAPLAYFILNPLIRNVENEKLVLTNQKKFLDAVLTDEQDVVVLNVVPVSNVLQRFWTNWIHSIKLTLARAPVLNHFFSIKQHLQKQYYPKHLDKIIAEVDKFLCPSDLSEKCWLPNQIQFKGLEYLLPYERKYFFEMLMTKHGYDFESNLRLYNFFTLVTDTGEKLDSVEVRGVNIADDISKRTFIISCLPYGNKYQDWINQHRYFADDVNTTVIAFNYRGKGLSKGYVFDQNDLVNDAYNQAARLIAMGANPKNIALMGECLAATIATKAAAKLHQEGYPVNLCNLRGFRTMSSLILGILTPDKNSSPLHPVSLLKKLVFYFAKFILSPLLHIVNWNLSSEEEFKSIPAECREYLTVHSKKDPITNKRAVDDPYISHRVASIYSLVKEEQNRLKDKRDKGQPLSKSEQLWLNDNRKLHQFHVSPVLRESAHKVNGHTCHLRYLAPTQWKQSVVPDGREYVLGFFKQIWFKNKVNEDKKRQSKVV